MKIKHSLWACLMGCWSCGDTTMDAVEAPAFDAGVQDAQTISEASSSAGCIEGASQSCACVTGGVGTQTCSGGSFGPCSSCNVAQKSKCVAGTYSGAAMGTALPQAFGIRGFIALAPVAINDRWTYSLVASDSPEFYTVGNGCAHGTSGGNKPGSARAYLSGNVDCATGILKGEVKGFYKSTSLDNPFEERPFYYKGTIEARFDPETQTFVDGAFEYAESKVLFGDPPGGHGNFTMALDTTAETSNENQEECLMGPFPDDQF